jgi:ribosomal protein S18 acetylase RimI-like enzyme
MTIRVASASDAEAIREVARASWETDYPSILGQEVVDDGVEEWYGVDSVRDALGESGTRLLVATDDAVVGFVHAVVDGDEGHVLRLYVDPEHRRRGVGSRLLERACEELFERGADRVFALVLADNERGNAFYRDHGFEKVDENETTIAGNSYREHTFVLGRD